MNKKNFLTAMIFSTLITVGDAQANEIHQMVEIINILESKFWQKIHAIITEDYWIISKKIDFLDQNTVCKRTKPFEHTIDGDKTNTVMYNCPWENDEKYIVSQSISKWKIYTRASVCKNITFYYLSVVEWILLKTQAAIIESKKDKSVYWDVLCDDIIK